MNFVDTNEKRGREALREVGAGEALLDSTPSGVLELIGRGESEVERLDRARSMLRTRRNRQQRITLEDRWRRVGGTPDGDLSGLDLFTDHTGG